MSDNVDTQAIVTALGIVSTFILGYIGYKQSRRANQTAEKAGAIEQIISGLNILIDNLQEDNKILRDNVKELRDALQAITQERDQLKAELKALVRKHSQTAK